ncbi:LysR substrate-binding domain-containing protein [Limnohabitans sp.]|uniref:LysR substrate-binding domain-containing protein n=1 Tax=Limnohabitans sp. TaxID=1907725 RepID=UPI0025BC49CC|nr:LysR substrate-binding domain-containing protein [Limnohabitans sp.]
MLNINAPPTFATRWLAPRLSDFRSQYPFIDLSITTDRIQTLKSARQHDCLVFFDQAPWRDLACQMLMQEHHIMACSPSLWHGNQPPKLVKATLLHILDGDKRLPVWEQWDLHFGLSGVDTQGGLHFSTLDQAINASIAGAGILVVDQTMIIQELQSGLLKRFDDRELMGPQAYWFAEITQNSQQKELVTTFRTWLMKQLSLSDTRAFELDELSLSPD